MNTPPAAWDDHVRLLRLGGRPAWLVDGQGGVVWAGPGGLWSEADINDVEKVEV